MLKVDQHVLDSVRARIPEGWIPKILIILGSGLGGLADKFADGAVRIPFEEIWPWATSKVEGHSKTLIMGLINGVPVMALAGRLHLYEGYTPQQVVAPVLLAKALGAENVLLTNAAGCIELDWNQNDLMIMVDHLNLTGLSPLTGENNPELGLRFPSMTTPYALQGLVRQAAQQAGTTGIREGVYVQMPGPEYETPATIRMLRIMGGNAVGMSSAVEGIAAVHCGMKVAGISLLTNMAAGITGQELSHDEVKAAATVAAEGFEALVMAVLGLVAEQG